MSNFRALLALEPVHCCRYSGLVSTGLAEPWCLPHPCRRLHSDWPPSGSVSPCGPLTATHAEAPGRYYCFTIYRAVDLGTNSGTAIHWETPLDCSPSQSDHSAVAVTCTLFLFPLPVHLSALLHTPLQTSASSQCIYFPSPNSFYFYPRSPHFVSCFQPSFSSPTLRSLPAIRNASVVLPFYFFKHTNNKVASLDHVWFCKYSSSLLLPFAHKLALPSQRASLKDCLTILLSFNGRAEEKYLLRLCYICRSYQEKRNT